MACPRCSNYILILDLTHGFNELGKDNCKMRRKTFKFLELVRLILEVWRYPFCANKQTTNNTASINTVRHGEGQIKSIKQLLSKQVISHA